MSDINQFDLPSKSYASDDQVKLIPAFLNRFARSRDVNHLFKFANKISKASSISEKNKKWLEWYSEYQKSCDFVKNENDNLPRIFYPKLPICDSVEEIKLLIRNNQFLIIRKLINNFLCNLLCSYRWPSQRTTCHFLIG